MLKSLSHIFQFDSIKTLLQGTDHVDFKVVESQATMREFIAGMLNFNSPWATFLYRLRGLLARIMGLQHGTVASTVFSLEELPMTPGATVKVFTLLQAQEEAYHVLEAEDRHLSGVLAIVVEP